MARPREQTAASDARTGLTCPECGRTFARAAGLGAHRRQAHGVAGTSARAAGSRRGRRRSAAPRAQNARSRSTATRNRRRGGSAEGRPRAQNPSSGANGIDRDALLRTLFPNGVPAREEALRAVSKWLDEADRLAAMR
jgi:hypothetical protein